MRKAIGERQEKRGERRETSSSARRGPMDDGSAGLSSWRRWMEVAGQPYVSR